MHGALNPLPWVRELNHCSADLSNDKSSVTWVFWIGHLPSSTYEMTIKMRRVLSDTNHFVWIPTEAAGFVLNDGMIDRHQAWVFNSQGELPIEPGMDWIPFLRATKPVEPF